MQAQQEHAVLVAKQSAETAEVREECTVAISRVCISYDDRSFHVC